MAKDYYVDSIMGTWALTKRTKKNLIYERRAEAKLHKDMAMKWIDPKEFKEYKVYGDVVLTEKKTYEIETGATNFFRGLDLTPTTVKEEKK